MWIVAKIKNNHETLFLSEIKKKVDPNTIFYSPKIQIENSIKKNILGNYVFCKSEIFKNSKILNNIKFLKGLKYFIPSFNKKDTEEIERFIENCKKNENENGLIYNSYFFESINKQSRLVSGPFKNFLLNILSIKDKTLIASVGKFRFVVKKKCNNYCYPH